MESVRPGSLFSTDEKQAIRPGSVVPYALIGSDGSLSHTILTAVSTETYTHWSASRMGEQLKWDPPELIRT
jgi:hypothetical protein